MKNIILAGLKDSVPFAVRDKTPQPFKRLGVENDRYAALSWGLFEEFDYDKPVEQYGRTLFDSRQKKITGFAEIPPLYNSYNFDPVVFAWQIDPLAHEYPNMSPYAAFNNNPVIYVDPDGRDVYRYDDKTGDMILFKETDDNFDQIGKFKYDKKSGEYTLQTNKKGEAKTRIDNVEKGILSDGINFKENNNMISVGEEGQATVGGVETFAVNLSDMVGKEIGGAYFSKDRARATTHISIGRYVNNKFDETRGHGQNLGSYPNLRVDYNKYSLRGFFHTHPSSGNISVSDRTRPSGKDLESKNKDLKLNPSMQFYILTHPTSYGNIFPYKINYTNW